MLKKSIILTFLIGVLIILFYYSPKQEINSFGDNIQKGFYTLINFQEQEKLKHQNIQLQKELISTKAKLLEFKELNQTLKTLPLFPSNSIVKLIKPISYSSILTKEIIFTTPKDLNKSKKEYGLIFNEAVAGVANYKEDKILGYLLNNKKTTFIVSINKEIGVAFGGKELKVKFLKKHSNIKVGDKVLTAGIDNLFFKNIKVGTVKSIKKEKMSLTATIEPFYKEKELKPLFLLTKTTPNLKLKKTLPKISLKKICKPIITNSIKEFEKRENKTLNKEINLLMQDVFNLRAKIAILKEQNIMLIKEKEQNLIKEKEQNLTKEKEQNLTKKDENLTREQNLTKKDKNKTAILIKTIETELDKIDTNDSIEKIQQDINKTIKENKIEEQIVQTQEENKTIIQEPIITPKPTPTIKKRVKKKRKRAIKRKRKRKIMKDTFDMF